MEEKKEKIIIIEHNNCTITVHKPILSPEEYTKRQKEVKKAVERFAISIEKAGTAIPAKRKNA